MSARVGGLITLHLIKPFTSRSIWSTVTSVSSDVRESTRRQTTPTPSNLPPPIKGDGSDTAVRCHGDQLPGPFLDFFPPWTCMEINAEWLSLVPPTHQAAALKRNQDEVHYIHGRLNNWTLKNTFTILSQRGLRLDIYSFKAENTSLKYNTINLKESRKEKRWWFTKRRFSNFFLLLISNFSILN